MHTLEPQLLKDAFLFGFPLVFNLDQVQRYVETGVGANPSAPFNSFSHARSLAGPADTFVSINNDTLYSMAQLDLSVGPVLLHTPDTAGRYFVLQFVDAWTNNFAYVGHRATGTDAQDFLLVPPGWSGQPVDGAQVIRFPTTVASIVGRWACQGEADLPQVHALQDATTLTQQDPAAAPAGIPASTEGTPVNLQFWEKLRLWSQAFPPAESDRPALESFATLGLTDRGESPYFALGEDMHRALAESVPHAQEELAQFLRAGGVPMKSGWQLAYHSFDYNSDFFEIGTVNSPLFTSVPPDMKYQLRAGAALGGLWGNHSYEAAYAAVYVDANGEQLDGAHRYTLRFLPAPPAKAFWSLTMYSMPDFFLVENSIHRYSIGSQTEGLHFDEDGALTIIMSHEAPADLRERANWLPTPSGPFRPLLRMYEPDTSVVDGEYEIPAIQRQDEAE
ncbi:MULTISPECIES: DUF1254 domain-containing protein [unclassified Leucobacter]|uniref:DUF1254 domain-containing protein n=1 Tax=unclassified Leucobacter TaxID=2621730 RepID=UPI00165D5619|nr:MULTISPECIES: DUF1254 domain-containing protein [unclassified Leucobacter]MBC9935920.1 DUF1254 domain-containing protein [Leucobacter sp. cx-87]